MFLLEDFQFVFSTFQHVVLIRLVDSICSLCLALHLLFSTSLNLTLSTKLSQVLSNEVNLLTRQSLHRLFSSMFESNLFLLVFLHFPIFLEEVFAVEFVLREDLVFYDEFQMPLFSLHLSSLYSE